MQKRNPIRFMLKHPIFKQKIVKNKKAEQIKKMCRGGVKSRPCYLMTRIYASDAAPCCILFL
jgi:hypothetical protein